MILILSISILILIIAILMLNNEVYNSKIRLLEVMELIKVLDKTNAYQNESINSLRDIVTRLDA